MGSVMLPNGNIWYADVENNRIVQYNPASKVIVRIIGRAGTDEGEFNGVPQGMTRDSNGNLYVLTKQCRVYKLDSNGGLLQETRLWEIADDQSPYYNANYPGCANSYDIAYNSYDNSILISDNGSQIVTKFTTDLAYLSEIASGDFVDITGISTDANGQIYVADNAADPLATVKVYSVSGTHLFDLEGSWTKTDESEFFQLIRDIVVLSDGKIVVSNQDQQRLEVFNSSGEHLSTLSGGALYPVYQPQFLSRDSSNNIYVSEAAINTIAKYNSSGTYQSVFSNHTRDENKLYTPRDVAYDPSSPYHMFVIDGLYDDDRRIQEFTNTGTFVRTVADRFSGAAGARFLTIGPDGKMYVSTPWAIQVYELVEGDWVNEYAISSDAPDNNLFFGRVAFDDDGNLWAPNDNNFSIQKYVLDEGEYVYDSRFGHGWDGDEDNKASVQSGVLYRPSGLAIDSSSQHFFVTDLISVREFDATGTWVRTIGTQGEGATQYTQATALALDNTADKVYVSDYWFNRIVIFNTSDGSYDSTIGGFGGEAMQMYRPIGATINPSNGLLTFSDSGNGRVQSYFDDSNTQVYNLIASANLIRTDSGHYGESLSASTWDPLTDFVDAENVPARLYFGDYAVADFTIDMTVSQDWSSVGLITQPESSLSLVTHLNPTDAPGISATHSLYITRYSNQTTVSVCPSATSLDQLNESCTDFAVLTEGDNENNAYPLTAVTLADGHSYWRIDGLTGTGAFSTLFTTGIPLRDLMTRLQADTESNHRIEFGTSYDLINPGDTIEVTFGTDWDFNGLLITDLVLIGDSATKTIAAAPGADIWGADIDDVNNVITFTAPDSGTTGYIAADAPIVVIIQNDVVINPATTGSFEISLRMESDTDPGPPDVEVGSVSVPIVDSDQVNVTAYINTFINFDIDTATDIATDCLFDECPLHAGIGAENGANYTVDLGELNSTWVNKSNDVDVMHSDNISGAINSIFIDLTTNATNGAIVTVNSSNGGLVSPGLANNVIASVGDGDDITANSGTYGFTMPDTATGNGTIVRNTTCAIATDYCALTTGQVEVFNTSSLPLDNGRIQMDLAAAAAYTNNPGTYTDTLTFVAVPTY